MKLYNLLEIVDENFNMILIGTDEEGKEHCYDFINNKWRDDSKIDPCELISVKDFFHHPKSMYLRFKVLEEFNVMRFECNQIFKKDHLYKNKVIKIKVFMYNSKTYMKNALDNKADEMIAKRIAQKEKADKENKEKRKMYNYKKRRRDYYRKENK